MPTPPDRDPSLIPSLIEDPYAATIAPPPLPSSENTAGRRPTHEQYLDSQKSNSDSLLVVADSTGHLHFFMDGYYSLGSHYLGISCNPVSVYAPPTPSYDPNTEAAPDAQLYVFATRYSTLFNPTPSAHPTSEDLNPDTLIPNPFGQVTSTSAASLRFPLLHAPWTRALARQSTTIRALLIYSSAVVKEMRDGWMGTPTREGARGLGAKWVAHLEQMQAAHGDCTYPPFQFILYLCCLFMRAGVGWARTYVCDAPCEGVYSSHLYVPVFLILSLPSLRPHTAYCTC